MLRRITNYIKKNGLLKFCKLAVLYVCQLIISRIQILVTITTNKTIGNIRNIETLSLLYRLYKKLEVMMLAKLRLVDWSYRNYYSRFETALTSLSEKIKMDHFSGVVFTIGSLWAGGSERQVVLTLKGLQYQGNIPLTLITFFLDTPEQRFYLPKVVAMGIPVETLNRNLKQHFFSSDAINVIQKLPQELVDDVTSFMYAFLKYRPAIVHLWLDETNIKAGIAAVMIGVPRIILSTRSLPPINFGFYQFYMGEGYRWLMRQPGVVMLNNSEAGARAYEKWLALPCGTIRVVRNGFDFDKTILDHYCNNRSSYRMKCGIPLDAPLVGTVIRLQEEKRPLLWAEIAAYVRKKIPDAHFLVVGDGPLRSELELRGKHSDLVGAIHIVGREEEVFAAMATMDLFLLTSRAEGLPNVLIEAQALGVPVVTTDVGGASETLDHGRTGWVLESEEVETIGNKIVQLLLDKDWRKQAGETSHQFVKQRFGLDRMIEETLALYNV